MAEKSPKKKSADPGSAAQAQAPQDPIAAAQDAVAQIGDLSAMVSQAAKGAPQGSTPSGEAQPMALPNLDGRLSPAQIHALDLLSDVHLNVKIELGRTRMLVEDVLRLSEGAVVELDKLAGDPVDVYVNERHVARGEVLVLNDNFCVRINEVLAPPVDLTGAKGAA